MQEVLDDAGQPIDIGAGNLILLVPRKLRKTARILSESELRPTTANNDTNVYNGIYTVIETVWTSALVSSGSDTAWYLISPSQNFLKFFNREPFNVEHDYDPDNRTLRTFANRRFSFGWSHWVGTWASKGDGVAYSS